MVDGHVAVCYTIQASIVYVGRIDSAAVGERGRRGCRLRTLCAGRAVGRWAVLARLAGAIACAHGWVGVAVRPGGTRRGRRRG